MRPRDSGVERMRDAARRLVDTVTEDLRGRLVRPFEEEDARRHWSYLPGRRPGVHFGELDRDARKAVHALVASGLQPHAYAQVAAIMALEDVLDEQEGSTRGRHNTDYWTVVFGDPEAGGRWGWRFEGHHTSLNLTVEATEVIAATPCFFGANPATVGYGPSPVLRPLGLEEELARAVLASMPGPLLWRAVVSDEAPSDIVTRFEPAVAAGLEPAGVRAGDLGAQPAGARRRPRPRLRRSRVRVGRPPPTGAAPTTTGSRARAC